MGESARKYLLVRNQMPLFGMSLHTQMPINGEKKSPEALIPGDRLYGSLSWQ
jgi:hypothetical protein